MSRLERIVAACGGILLNNGTRALIPGPDHSRKDRSVSLVETADGRVLVHCFSPHDHWRAVRRALAEKGLLDEAIGAVMRRPHLTPPRIATQPADEDRVARARRLWEEGRPIRWTPAASYLSNRAIPANLCATNALRFHPRVTSLDDRVRRPALVAAITNLAGELQGVQVTLLTVHGAAKAPVPTPRRVIGKLMGGVVRLGDPVDELAIGEGVETMLSASRALRLPAWAALTAANLSLFDPPPSVRRLVVAVDNDAAGDAACDKLRLRLSRRLDFDKAAPPTGADDWNAWALAKRDA
jgi:hypothetical protein